MAASSRRTPQIAQAFQMFLGMDVTRDIGLYDLSQNRDFAWKLVPSSTPPHRSQAGARECERTPIRLVRLPVLRDSYERLSAALKILCARLAVAPATPTIVFPRRGAIVGEAPSAIKYRAPRRWNAQSIELGARETTSAEAPSRTASRR